MKTETILLNRERNVSLTAYLQETGGEFANIPKRPAVLMHMAPTAFLQRTRRF